MVRGAVFPGDISAGANLAFPCDTVNQRELCVFGLRSSGVYDSPLAIFPPPWMDAYSWRSSRNSAGGWEVVPISRHLVSRPNAPPGDAWGSHTFGIPPTSRYYPELGGYSREGGAHGEKFGTRSGFAIEPQYTMRMRTFGYNSTVSQ